MEPEYIKDYTPDEFVLEFFKTFLRLLWECLQAIVYALDSFGMKYVFLVVYIFLILLAVAKESNRSVRKRDEANRALEASVAEYLEEERRLIQENEERMAVFKYGVMMKNQNPRRGNIEKKINNSRFSRQLNPTYRDR